MQTWQIVAIAIAVIAILAAIGWLVYTRKRSERLRDHFGTEYDRRVSELEGNRRRAEAELTEREARVQELKHQPLSSSERTRFIEEWRICQARFVDDPPERLTMRTNFSATLCTPAVTALMIVMIVWRIFARLIPTVHPISVKFMSSSLNIKAETPLPRS